MEPATPTPHPHARAAEDEAEAEQASRPPRGAGRAQRRARIAVGAAAVLLVGALAFTLLGDRRTFDAEGFVRAANEAGAGLGLGDPLRSGDEDKQLFELLLTDARGPGPAPDDPVEAEALQSASTLAVLPGEQDAEAELDRCRSTLSFVCYRAANVVIAADADADPSALDRLGRSLRRLADEPPD